MEIGFHIKFIFYACVVMIDIDDPLFIGLSLFVKIKYFQMKIIC